MVKQSKLLGEKNSKPFSYSSCKNDCVAVDSHLHSRACCCKKLQYPDTVLLHMYKPPGSRPQTQLFKIEINAKFGNRSNMCVHQFAPCNLGGIDTSS